MPENDKQLARGCTAAVAQCMACARLLYAYHDRRVTLRWKRECVGVVPTAWLPGYFRAAQSWMPSKLPIILGFMLRASWSTQFHYVCDAPESNIVGFVKVHTFNPCEPDQTRPQSSVWFPAHVQVTIDQVIGGARGIKSMIWETSNLDADEVRLCFVTEGLLSRKRGNHAPRTCAAGRLALSDFQCFSVGGAGTKIQTENRGRTAESARHKRRSAAVNSCCCAFAHDEVFFAEFILCRVPAPSRAAPPCRRQKFTIIVLYRVSE